MENKMIDTDAETAGLLTGILVATGMHFFNLNIGPIVNPFWAEIVEGMLRVGFTALSAVAAYLAVHYVKKLLKHPEK